MFAAAAHATERHEWYVLRTSEGAYAFDAQSVETEIGSGVVSVSILIGKRTGHTNVDYDVDCSKNRGELTSNAQTDAKPTDSGWLDIPKTGSLKVAADVACRQDVPGAIRVKSEKAALAKLKTLSK